MIARRQVLASAAFAAVLAHLPLASRGALAEEFALEEIALWSGTPPA